MEYHTEFNKLLDAARQVSINTDFDKRKVHSFAALRVLRNAVQYYDDAKEQSNAADACSCAELADGADACPHWKAWGKCKLKRAAD